MISKQHMWSLRQIAKGKCSKCNRPLVTKTLCEYHRLKDLSIKNKKYKERQQKHLCVRCGKPLATSSKSLCPKHLEYQRIHQEAYRRKKHDK